MFELALSLDASGIWVIEFIFNNGLPPVSKTSSLQNQKMQKLQTWQAKFSARDLFFHIVLMFIRNYWT